MLTHVAVVNVEDRNIVPLKLVVDSHQSVTHSQFKMTRGTTTKYKTFGSAADDGDDGRRGRHHGHGHGHGHLHGHGHGHLHGHLHGRGGRRQSLAVACAGRKRVRRHSAPDCQVAAGRHPKALFGGGDRDAERGGGGGRCRDDGDGDDDDDDESTPLLLRGTPPKDAAKFVW